MRNYPKSEFENLHLGQYIKSIVTNNGIEYTWVAKQLGISTTGLYHRFNSPIYSDIYEIVKLSMLINIDIMALIYKELNMRYPEFFKMKVSEQASYFPGNQSDINQKLMDENRKLYDLISVLKQNK